MRRRIYAAGAIRRRAAPDALVPAGAVPMYLVGGIYATVPVACAAAPLAVLFVVTVLVDLVRAVDAAVAVARTAAMPTFARHLKAPFVVDFLLDPQHVHRTLYQIAANTASTRNRRASRRMPPTCHGTGLYEIIPAMQIGRAHV